MRDRRDVSVRDPPLVLLGWAGPFSLPWKLDRPLCRPVAIYHRPHASVLRVLLFQEVHESGRYEDQSLNPIKEVIIALFWKMFEPTYSY